ncbi:DNA-processing protein DprA [Pseudomarimonas arenosa]|uniref:DNA-protecting protein DprA n=1 Tax=Pseudomarimonas arenosa TaxID=2774145 RepID=A0AAW3ZI65_9GAMM|nr:DNA-processing protein DprA [Pseudomarimonas arenosa]MBD8525214.1 DNA-protecting protein DprA [Pseudomarimonas arenosa]
MASARLSWKTSCAHRCDCSKSHSAEHKTTPLTETGEALNAVADEASAWLALARVEGLGGGGIRRLLDIHGNALAAWRALPHGGLQAGLTPAVVKSAAKLDLAALEQDRAWLASPDCHLLPCTDPLFPPQLAETPNAPALLFLRGDPQLLCQPQVAVVGSRNPTAAGRDNAYAFARALAEAGLLITSGLAEGVDSAAHRAALDAGRPTLAVMGTGVDRIYPAHNARLAAEIVGHGALISEFPPGTPARRDHFPRRNRIVVGLSLGTLVIEAALKSGALISARQAVEAGREVFALPGSIHNPLAKGCHRLIRDGAHLIETADEIIAMLGPAALRLGQQLQQRLGEAARVDDPGSELLPAGLPGDPDYQRLWRALDHSPSSAVQLQQRTGLTAQALSSMLLRLELDGWIDARAGRYLRRSG